MIKSDLHPKEIKIQDSVYKNQSYSDKGNSFTVNVDKECKDTFLSNVPAIGGKNVQITTIYSGKSNEVPVDLLEKLLCTADSSYNPSRPFRWYKGGGVALTDEVGSVEKCRNESFNFFLKQIDSPEYVFIYEMEII